MYLNKAYLIGNLTRDPELKSLPTGNKVTQFSIATNRVYKLENGTKQESTEYHNITVFGRQAETSAQYLKKGQSVLIEGRLQTRSWDDKETGKKMHRTEIVAENVQFGNKTGGDYNSSDANTDTGTAPSARPPRESQPANTPELDTIDYGEELDPNDIPF